MMPGMMPEMMFLLLFALGQAPSPSDLKRALTDKIEQMMELVNQLPTVPSSTPELILEGENLQAALARGGTIELQSGGTFKGQFTIIKSGTRINCHGATLLGTSTLLPAVYNPPEIDDTWLSDCIFASPSVNAVVQVGDNGPTQTSCGQQPERIIFTNIKIPTHRGKRGIEFNGSGAVIDSQILDVYSAAGAESQALWLGNSCGPLMVLRSTLIGASENFMSGGDTNKMGAVPSEIVLDTVTLEKPEAWRGKVPVKNLFEIKSGRTVILKNSTLRRNWVSGQEGTAIVLTPRSGGYVQDVLIENNTIDDVPLGLQLLGKDNPATLHATSGIIVRNNKWNIKKGPDGRGRGVPVLMTGGTLDVTFENVDLTFDGNAIVVADGAVPQGPFTLHNSRSELGKYAILKPGANYGDPTPATHAGRELVASLEGNTLKPGANMTATDLSRVKKNFPNNTYVPR